MTQSQLDNIINWQRIFADNSNLEDNERGIIKFSRMMFPEFIKPEYSISDIHRHIYEDCLNLYDPALRFLPERQEQIIVFRGGSKSTIVLGVFAAYIVCVNGHDIILPNSKIVTVNEDVICMSSETGTFAENWTVRLRYALSSKPFLNQVYGNMKRGKLQDEEGKWQLGNFTVKKDKLPHPYTGKNCAVIARGTGQQIRGINLNGRITLWLVDDIYSKNNIKTVEGRQNIRYWFNAEAKNSIDLNEGKVISIGTVVHEDTVIVDNKKSSQWKTIEYPIMEFDKFQEVLKHCKINMDEKTCIIPSTEECYKLEQQGYQTNWPEKFPLELILMKYVEAVKGNEGQTISMFYQEYFHITLAEEDKVIRRAQMLDREMELIYREIDGFKYSFIKIGEEYIHVNTIIGIDAAGSTSEGADPTALVMVCKDFYERVYVFRSKSFRCGTVDDFKTPELAQSFFGRLCTDYNNISRIGSADEVFRWMGQHKSEIAVEIQSTIGHEIVRQIYKRMASYGKRVIVHEVPATTKKEERILNTLSPYYQSRSIFHNTDQERLKTQLELLGKVKNDDEADILEVCVRKLRKPSKLIKWKDKEEYVERDFNKRPPKNFFAALSKSGEVNAVNKWKTV